VSAFRRAWRCLLSSTRSTWQESAACRRLAGRLVHAADRGDDAAIFAALRRSSAGGAADRPAGGGRRRDDAAAADAADRPRAHRRSQSSWPASPDLRDHAASEWSNRTYHEHRRRSHAAARPASQRRVASTLAPARARRSAIAIVGRSRAAGGAGARRGFVAASHAAVWLNHRCAASMVPHSRLREQRAPATNRSARAVAQELCGGDEEAERPREPQLSAPDERYGSARPSPRDPPATRQNQREPR